MHTLKRINGENEGKEGGNCERRGTIYLTSVADEGSEDQAYQLSQQHSLH